MTDSKPMNQDPHLPPPEVCDWLLSQEWPGVIPETVITYPKGNPGGISKSEKLDYVSARIAIGSDDIADVFMPLEALEKLQGIHGSRCKALDEERRKCQGDEEARKSAWMASRKWELTVPPESTQPLSPAAQVVLDAVASSLEGGWISPDFIPYESHKAAAILRAVADQVVPHEPVEALSFTNEAIRLNRMGIREELLAIAAELGASPITPPDLAESNEPDIDHEIALLCDSITAAHTTQVDSKEPIISSEWCPCVKLPVTVHVREQRPGETHVSTREGIAPVSPDDLIMLGVQGEEYPIDREIFEKTYQLLPIPQEKAQP